MLQALLGLAIVAGVLMEIGSEHDRNGVTMEQIADAPKQTQRILARMDREQRARQIQMRQASARRHANSDGVSQTTDGLVVSIANSYQVPAGLLYGVWQKESHGRTSGWGTSRNWVLAHTMARPGSACANRKGLKWCQAQWAVIRAMCTQRRNGKPICDANEVKTSYLFAMGPMQHLPTSLTNPRNDGGFTWAPHAVDYDGDGVFDPHTLADSLASAAVYLKRRYAKAPSKYKGSDRWRWAANAYFGIGQTAYFDGRPGSRGVYHHWQSFCQRTASCSSSRKTFASR